MSTPLRVLILEDRLADAELMADELRAAGFEPDWRRVETEADFLAALEDEPEVILADYVMPQLEATRALSLLCERGFAIPFIVVSGSVSEELAVDAMKAGAADYLLKDRLARLGPAVVNALEQRDLQRDKRMVDAALRESEERFRRLAENAPDVIYRYRIDEPHGFEYVSPAVAPITGYTPEEYHADPDLGPRIVHPEDRPLLEGLGRGEVDPAAPLLLRLVRKDGSLVWTEQHNVFIRDEEDRLLAIEGIARDVTERKRLEEQLLRSQKMEAILAVATPRRSVGRPTAPPRSSASSSPSAAARSCSRRCSISTRRSPASSRCCVASSARTSS